MDDDKEFVTRSSPHPQKLSYGIGIQESTMRHLATCLLTLALSGCAAQQQAQRAKHFQNEISAATSYCNSFLSNPALNPIRQKVSMGSEPTFEMLANEEKPTAEEKTAIRLGAEIAMQCQTKFTQVFQSNLAPIYVSVYTGAIDSQNALRVNLYNGQIKYGEYNREVKRLRTEWLSAWARLDADYARQNADAQYRAQQSAQQTYQNFLLYQQNLQQQQTLFQQQHGTVSCNRIGAYTYCNY